MPVRLDPEERETASLFAMVGEFSGKRVLEVGCGDGRLTWRYARQADYVLGIDPDPDSIAEAHKQIPLELEHRVHFVACELGQFNTTQLFDLIIMSWSL
jgi:2-polyprenyl-3-methyl-5-hydroxy-6-metoxy-1,4-benzoquinol methylase